MRDTMKMYVRREDRIVPSTSRENLGRGRVEAMRRDTLRKRRALVVAGEEPLEDPSIERPRWQPRSGTSRAPVTLATVRLPEIDDE